MIKNLSNMKQEFFIEILKLIAFTIFVFLSIIMLASITYNIIFLEHVPKYQYFMVPFSSIFLWFLYKDATEPPSVKCTNRIKETDKSVG